MHSTVTSYQVGIYLELHSTLIIDVSTTLIALKYHLHAFYGLVTNVIFVGVRALIIKKVQFTVLH